MLVAENISKSFSGVKALNNVNLQLLPGMVNAIIGENGAGKSTLMKILSGVYPEYEGRIIYKGDTVRFSNPKEAQQCGIAIIHQELNLIPHLCITENIFLGQEIINGWGMLDKKAMKLKTQQLLDKLKLNVSPDTLIADLKVGQQQVVEIAKALLTESEVIIMDEPTSAISEKEVEVLFNIIDDLRAEGKAIVYISHKLDELFKIADRYIILRDGQTIETGEMQGITHDGIINKMVGRDIDIIRSNDRECATDAVLSVNNLSLDHPVAAQRKLLSKVSFELCKGEILGIFGLMGAGRTELLETIMGMHPKLSSGQVMMNSNHASFKRPADAIKAGIALVPEDRKKDGLVLGLDVKTNISLTCLKSIQTAGLLDNTKEAALAKKYIDTLKIKTSSQTQTAKNLSGGNQQKIVLAKCLATLPKILMLDEPTRGIDVNAKNEIYKLITDLANAGLSIIMVSSELPEILAISDRVLVMAEGKITANIKCSDATEDSILKAAIPTTI
jgi:ribose transport system ATP-binding protein